MGLFIKKNGQLVPVNITNKVSPQIEKGLVFEDYDSDGYYHTARFVGNWTSISSYRFCGVLDYLMSSRVLTLTIPEGVESIGNYAFGTAGSNSSRRLSITTLNLPSTLTSIGREAFDRCTHLTSLTLPNGITTLPFGIFNGCERLTNLTLPNALTSIGNYCFAVCKALQNLTLPSTITSIGEYAFSSCYYLTSISIPSGITFIGNGAFKEGYSLTSVVYEGNVPNINGSTFLDCNNVMLYDFSNATSVPTLANTIALGHKANCIIRIPSALADTWQNATNWISLTNVVWQVV